MINDILNLKAFQQSYIYTLWFKNVNIFDIMFYIVLLCISKKAMVTHSSTLAWRVPWTEEPGGLQSMALQSRTQLSDFIFTFMHWRRKWQPTPVFLPGESQGRRSLVGCRLWGRPESDTTEATQQQQQQLCILCVP